MQRLLATALATLIAAAVLSAASTAPEARVKSCRSQLTACLNDCKGHIRDDYRLFCNSRCNDAYKSCRHDEVYHPKGKANDPKPKKGIDGTPSTGTWVPNSPKKGIDSTQPPLKWVPNSPAKGKGVPSVPAGGTWTPSPSSGAKGPILRSSGGR
jgi:hypothetical protein